MDKIRIPVSKTIGSEFQCLEGWGKNSKVYKKGRNPSVWKDKIIIPMLIEKSQNPKVLHKKIWKLMYIKIGPEFQCLEE